MTEGELKQRMKIRYMNLTRKSMGNDWAKLMLYQSSLCVDEAAKEFRFYELEDGTIANYAWFKKWFGEQKQPA